MSYVTILTVDLGFDWGCSDPPFTIYPHQLPEIRDGKIINNSHKNIGRYSTNSVLTATTKP